MRKLIFALLLLATSVQARVISYAPYSDRVSYPALQNRLNRHIVVIEGDSPAFNGGILISPPPYGFGTVSGQVVIYDTQGREEPRVVFPAANTLTNIAAAAVREDASGVLAILIQTNYNFNGSNPNGAFIWLLSADGGTNWQKVPVPSGIVTSQFPAPYEDNGGPFVHARGSQIRIGTLDTPFVVMERSTSQTASLFSVGRDGAVKTLYDAPNGYLQLAGSSRDGSRFVFRSPADTLRIIDLAGNTSTLGPIELDANVVEAWVTPSAANVYAEVTRGVRELWLYSGGSRTRVSGADTSSGSQVFFAVPTADYNGAWMILRGTNQPTTLLRHTPGSGLQEQWRDITSPEVEALHAGASGNTLLIQVHRPRVASDQRLFKDPALAVWHVGDTAAPRVYDELYMAEQFTKAFVHVDVDRLEAGDMFVFDSGPVQQGGGVIVSPPPPTSGGGGSDVVQEWGVVKASLNQRLVIPGIGRTPGAFGSFWVTDVTLRNPNDVQLTIVLRFAPNGEVQTADVKEKSVTLAAREIRLISDVLKTLFGYESGGGALFITPPVGASIDAAARTYSTSDKGTFGFGMNAIDLFSAASPRFPLSFAGAFPGANFRTNLVLTDVSGRGSEAALLAAGTSGITGNSGVAFSAIPNGQQQINFIGGYLGLASNESAALLLTPTRGETIAGAFAIDNRTNDPTYFPPDLPATTVRTIPAIGHVDGANGSRFRSDLFLFNPAKQLRTVTLQCTPWDQKDQPVTINLTLLANEARVIRDVLYTAFGKTGIARLRFQSAGDPGVRVTSRTYTLNDDGGTYGFLMPPLNSFQGAGPGDTLEILGAINDKHFRTNLGVVDLTAFANASASSRFRVEVIGATGNTLDSFETSVGSASGVQLNDLFGARNVTESGPVLLRVTALSGTIGTFATMIDNGTNDSMYLPANLAPKN